MGTPGIVIIEDGKDQTPEDPAEFRLLEDRTEQLCDVGRRVMECPTPKSAQHNGIIAAMETRPQDGT